jgi:hypothetical protein
LFPDQGWAGYILTWLVITWLAGAQWAAMCWLMDKAEE